MTDEQGNGAMEFLMTYGWAILVVLAAIGALAYFGVLSPDTFAPKELEQNATCSAWNCNCTQDANVDVAITRNEHTCSEVCGTNKVEKQSCVV